MPGLQLNPHARSLFLIHRGDNVFIASYYERKSPSVFFQSLIISRNFIRASQLYRTYHFSIIDFCDNNKFNLRLSRYRTGGTWSQDFQLTLEEIRRLNLLFDVQYIDVFEYVYKNAAKYSELCKIFRRHIALCLVFDQSENEIHHHEIIKQVQNQLYSIRCHKNSLLAPVEIPRLDLIYCACSKIENFYQIKQILTKHRIRHLATRNEHKHSDPKFDETIDDDYFLDFPVCPRIQKLHFVHTQLDENHEMISKIIKMVPFFPNLKHVECYLSAEKYASKQFTSQKLIAWIKKESKTIEQLRNACPSNTSIKLIYTFNIHKLETLKTVKQQIKHILTKTKFSQLNFFKHAISDSTNENGVAFVRTYYYTIVKWKEGNFHCGLNFEGNLNTITPEDEAIEKDDHLLVTVD